MVTRSKLLPALLLIPFLAGEMFSHNSFAYAASGSGVTKPAPPRPGSVGRSRMGILTTASGDTLKISMLPTHKTLTVRLTTKTTYVVNGKASRSRPSWKKGEMVWVIAKQGKNGTYSATSVMVGRPAGRPGGPPPGGFAPTGGTVVASSGSSVVLKTRNGKTTYRLTSSTRYLVNGKSVRSRPAFKTGQLIHVFSFKSSGTLTASMVVIGSMPSFPSAGPPPA